MEKEEGGDREDWTGEITPTKVILLCSLFRNHYFQKIGAAK